MDRQTLPNVIPAQQKETILSAFYFGNQERKKKCEACHPNPNSAFSFLSGSTFASGRQKQVEPPHRIRLDFAGVPGAPLADASLPLDLISHSSDIPGVAGSQVAFHEVTHAHCFANSTLMHVPD